MRSYNLGVYASLALAANAVLVPPNVALDSFGDGNAMETLAINPFKRTVALECPGCAFATAEDKHLTWAQGAGNTLLLDFDIGPREDSLEINGVQLYPPTFDFFPEPFYVTQVDPQRASEETVRLRVTGYTFHFNSAETVTEAGAELLPMTFRITSIESMPFDQLPTLRINLLKDANGRLMIASFQTAPANESPIDQNKECNDWPLLCKWKSILADKYEHMRESMRKGCHMHKGNPMAQEGTHGKPPHTFRPGHPHHRPHHRPHFYHHAHHHAHHHTHHRVHMFLRRAFFTIFIPILVGIFAGTLTYIVGMALGCLIAIIVAKVRGRAPYESVAQEDDSEDDHDVEGGTKEEYAELPEYDAPPVYEEAAEKEVVAETH